MKGTKSNYKIFCGLLPYCKSCFHCKSKKKYIESLIREYLQLHCELVQSRWVCYYDIILLGFWYNVIDFFFHSSISNWGKLLLDIFQKCLLLLLNGNWFRRNFSQKKIEPITLTFWAYSLNSTYDQHKWRQKNYFKNSPRYFSPQSTNFMAWAR